LNRGTEATYLATRCTLTDMAAIVRPNEPERPFREPYQREPYWLRDELAPPRLAWATAG
jgi:hypothetical protein